MKLIDIFGSVRLTIPLLLFLAIGATFGTFAPAEQGRYDLFYKSIPFRGLIALLIINLTICTVRTIRRILSADRRFLDTLQEGDTTVSGTIPDSALAQIHAFGYRTRHLEGFLIAERGLIGRWGSTITHLSFLLVTIGALIAGFGFVGTINIYIGDQTPVVYDWDLEADRNLGFDFRLDSFELLYYPREFRCDVVDAVTGEPLGSIEGKEGETVAAPRGGLSIRIDMFDPEKRLLAFTYLQEGREVGWYRHANGEVSTGPVDPGLKYLPTHFRDPIIRQMHSEVSIIEAGNVVKRGAIEINHPVVHRGITIYQTAHGQDEQGRPFAGFQFTDDPGEFLVWPGCIGMVLGCLLAFTLRYRAFAVRLAEAGTEMVPLTGYNTAESRDLLEELIGRIATGRGPKPS